MTTYTTSKPLRWLAFGSLAMIALQSATAEDSLSAFTVTKTETITVWGDGSWPTQTITQMVPAEDCPPEPRYSCYTVRTTTLSAQIPHATIHMVLPPMQQQQSQEGRDMDMDMDWTAVAMGEIGLGVESSVDGENWMESPSWNPNEAGANSVTLAPKAPFAAEMTGVTQMSAPACVNYVTVTSASPCPMVTPMSLDSMGCAIITSTSFALSAVTAVPDNLFGKLDAGGRREDEEPLTYTIHGGDCAAPSRHWKHPPPTSTPTPTPMPGKLDQEVIPSSAIISTAALLSQIQDDEPTFPTRLGYTISFDFNYGIAMASPTPTFPELPGPITTPIPEATPILIIPTNSASEESSVDLPVTSTPTAAASTDEIASTDVPQSIPTIVAATTLEIQSMTTDIPELMATTTISSSLPLEQVKPAPIKGGGKKTCQACAEPCVVDIHVVANAEVPLLVSLFEDKVKSALTSLRLTLDTDFDGSREKSTGLFHSLSLGGGGGDDASVHINIATAASLFHKTCDEKIEHIQRKHLNSLRAKCEHAIHAAGCETGECMQSKVDKAVEIMDVMISTELARDCSLLRSEIVQEFRKKCDDEEQHSRKSQDIDAEAHADADAKVEKRGLLGELSGALDLKLETGDKSKNKNHNDNDKTLLGMNIGGTLNDVVGKTVAPLSGDIILRLVDGLTGPVKSVVDSFVSNCNRKGLLDFDTEKGVGALAAVTDVSLNLFKVVCVDLNVDAKVDGSVIGKL